MFTPQNVAPRKGYENVFATLTPPEQKVWSLNTPVITAGPARPGHSAALVLFQGNLIVNLIAAPMVVITAEYVFIVLPTKTWQGLISSLIECDFIQL